MKVNGKRLQNFMNVFSMYLIQPQKQLPRGSSCPTFALKKLNLHSDLFYIRCFPFNKLPKWGIETYINNKSITVVQKKSMLALCFVINMCIYLLFWYTRNEYYAEWVGGILNIVMISILYCRFGRKLVQRRLLSSEVLPSMFYLLWLFLYPREQIIYVLPQFVSFVGKLYLLLCPPDKLEIDHVEQLILLQSKVEIFIMLYHPWALLYSSSTVTAKIINLAFLLATMKLKFTAHYGTRKAYQQVHLGLDRMAKGLNVRKGYQKVQALLCKLGEPHLASTKRVTYY